MGENSNKSDALLSKLDSLMKSGRAENRSNTPPVLTEALPDDQQDTIPTLTDAIGNRRLDSAKSLSEAAERVQDVIAARLVTSVDREMADLSKELPALQDKLAVVHRSIKFALPQLVNMRWADSTVADDDADAVDDTGTNPDQQT
jgi:hypothetical protein